MKPYLNTETVRLSKMLNGPREPGLCQLCGATHDNPVYQEHDHNDQPEEIWVSLCKPCAEKVIEPHPRLYAQKEKWAPTPGAMGICADCMFRQGLTCHNPLLKRLGGDGLPITYKTPPARAFICASGGRGGLRLFFYDPPICQGKS